MLKTFATKNKVGYFCSLPAKYLKIVLIVGLQLLLVFEILTLAFKIVYHLFANFLAKPN